MSEEIKKNSNIINITEIDKKDKELKKTDINTTLTKSNKFVNYIQKHKISLGIILVCIIIAIILYLWLKPSNKLEAMCNKKDKKNKEDTNKEDTEDTEGYKPDQVRTDPYDEYDADSAIQKLLKKQEKYLEKINSYIDYQ